MPPILYLIDGHALAYRSYFALTKGQPTGRWITSSGEPTAGVYGFISVLLRILEQENPDYLAVVFDTGKTFRDDIYPDYKATREKMPDELRSQIERIRKLIDAFNIPRLEEIGYEADDVLGSVAKKAVADGLGVKIFTGDRDLLQLVDERVIVNLPGRSLADAKDYLAADVVESLGVRPDQVVDYKALMGDSSDNIPGVAGVGKKTASKLLNEYETLDGVYEHLDELSAGLKKKLEEGHEKAYLSQKLAAIVTDLEIDLDLDKARPDNFNPPAVHEAFRELEFRSLLKRVEALEEQYGKSTPRAGQQMQLFGDASRGTKEPIPKEPHIQVHIVNTPESLDSLVKALESASMIAFDTETTSTDKMQADLVGISLAVNEEAGYYIPVGHQEGEQLPLAMVIEALRGPFTNPDIPKAGHNLKYDFVMLARNGLKACPLSFDSMLAEWLINPDSRNLGLKNLSWVRLGHQMKEIEELIGKGKKQISMAQVPIANVALYAADDAVVVLRLIPQLKLELEEAQAMSLFDEMEMPLINVLAEMEMTGIGLDVEFLKHMSIELETRLVEIKNQVYQAVGESFNLNSPKQLSEALFDKLGIAPPDGSRKTASGYYSTAAGVLENLRKKNPVVDLILEYRELAKLKSTYVDALPQQVNPVTGRVHTSYNQSGSRTGRIASSDPNLQNIPIRTELGRRVREAFIASPGHQLLAVDYSQVELRIAAHMAQDEAMLAAFNSGQDIHATTASAVYDLPLDAVNSTQRRHAKAINFGLIYGMSPFGLTRTTDLTLAEAEDFVSAYFRKFPGVKQYLDGIRELAADQGYVETLLGRRRYFPGLKNPQNMQIRNREEREAINAPIQGTAADIMKIAMLRMPDALKEAELSIKMLLQVHDELVLECPIDEINAAAAVVSEVMEAAFTLDIPLHTDVRNGDNWGILQPLN
ncbi:MAG: DNA polymerase I [Anaerolineales bacterium]|nr:DNA polymerase I [Chloroflexota bacterium]MBL6981732.1 DNA polymerase I [Anaerolineales bacterium]